MGNMSTRPQLQDLTILSRPLLRVDLETPGAFLACWADGIGTGHLSLPAAPSYPAGTKVRLAITVSGEPVVEVDGRVEAPGPRPQGVSVSVAQGSHRRRLADLALRCHYRWREDASPPADNDAWRVVLAEDNIFIRQTIRRVLQRVSAEVGRRLDLVEVADGYAALQATEQQAPQLLITDSEMPVMGGAELVGALHERLLDVSVLVLAKGPDDANRYLALGVDGVLVKPIIHSTLLEQLIYVIHLRDYVSHRAA